MNTLQKKTEKRLRLKKKIRSKIFGTAELPRLTVFRSNAHIYAQLIDDTKGNTLYSFSDMNIKGGTKKDHALAVGEGIAEVAKKAGITSVVFDRNGFKYTGRVKILADAARTGGLTF